MTKDEFLTKLKVALSEDCVSNTDNLIEYYNEMICDRMEDGMDEEAAVAAMGPVEEIVRNVSMEKTIGTLVKQKVDKSRQTAKQKGSGGLWILLVILGFPIWFPLLITLFTLILVLYLVPWIILIAIFSALLGIGASAVTALFASVAGTFMGLSLGEAIMCGGAALILGSLTVLLFKPALILAKGILALGKAIIKGIKYIIVGGKKQ